MNVDLVLRVLARYKQALGNTDWVVKNPDLQPTKLARRYGKELLNVGVGTQIDYVRSVADIPPNFAYRIYTVIDVTPLRHPPIRVSFRLSVAEDGEAVGEVLLSKPNKGTSFPKGPVDHVVDHMGRAAVTLIKQRI